MTAIMQREFLVEFCESEWLNRMERQESAHDVSEAQRALEIAHALSSAPRDQRIDELLTNNSALHERVVAARNKREAAAHLLEQTVNLLSTSVLRDKIIAFLKG